MDWASPSRPNCAVPCCMKSTGRRAVQRPANSRSPNTKKPVRHGQPWQSEQVKSIAPILDTETSPCAAATGLTGFPLSTQTSRRSRQLCNLRPSHRDRPRARLTPLPPLLPNPIVLPLTASTRPRQASTPERLRSGSFAISARLIGIGREHGSRHCRLYCQTQSSFHSLPAHGPVKLPPRSASDRAAFQSPPVSSGSAESTAHAIAASTAKPNRPSTHCQHTAPSSFHPGAPPIGQLSNLRPSHRDRPRARLTPLPPLLPNPIVLPLTASTRPRQASTPERHSSSPWLLPPGPRMLPLPPSSATAT